MCKLFTIVSILLLSISVTAQRQNTKSDSNSEQNNQIIGELTSKADSSQYIIGAYIGQYLTSNNLAITNATLFLKGMNDVLTNKPLLVNADSIPAKMNEYMARLTRERNELLEKQLFDKVKGQPGTGMLPNGVCYMIAKPGSGPKPQATDSVQLHVKGYLPAGNVFEDTYARNAPLKTIPARLIPGMREALQIMPAGSVWRVFIPSELAYGETGVAGLIPPYSAVVFDVNLLEVKTNR